MERGILGVDLPTPARGIAVVGDVAYVAAGAQGVIVLDVREPGRPRRLARCDTGGEAWAVAVLGSNAYVANGVAGLAVLDVSEAGNPRVVGTLDTPGNVISVAVTNGFAFLADNWIGMRVVDVRQPTRPVSVSVFPDEQINSVAVSGNYVYLASNLTGIYVVDASDRANPRMTMLYSLFRKGFSKGLHVSGNYLYAALDHAGLAIFNLTFPGGPGWVGECEVEGFASNVTVANGYAYVACGQAGMSVVDVRDAAAPRWVATQKTAGSVFGVAAQGGFAYAADGWGGVQVVDVTAPASPKWISVHQTGFQQKDISLSASNRLYVADGSRRLRVFEWTGALPALLGEFVTRGETTGVAVSGAHAFVSAGMAGVQVVDIVDPNRMFELNHLETGGEANATAVSSNHLFVASGMAGLVIYNIELLQMRTGGSNSPSAGATKVATVGVGDSVNGLAIDGDWAYLAVGKKGLVVVDISNLTAPRVVGSFDTSGDARAVEVVDGVAYVADGWAGVEAIDVSDRARPWKVGGYETAGFALSVEVVGDKLLLADSFGLVALDISAPESIQLNSEYKTASVYDVAVGEERLFAITRTNSVATFAFEPQLKVLPLVSSSQSVGLQVRGPAGTRVQLQVSTNLSDWVDAQSFILEAGATNLVEVAAFTETSLFYRAHSPKRATAASVTDLPQIILDSDLGVDADDIGDLALLHKLADAGFCKILGITYSTFIPSGPPALEAINIAYGRPNLPVATTKNSSVLSELTDFYDQFLVDNFPNTLRHATNAPDAVRFYRETLAKAAPRSVTIIEASYINALHDFFFSGPDDISPLTGEELMNEKVKVFGIAAGDYPAGVEFYFKNIPQTSTRLVNRLKCPVIYSGDTFGFYVHTAHTAQLRQFMPTNSITRRGLEEFYRLAGQGFREAWAQPLIWYLTVGDSAAGQKLFDLERGGYNYVGPSGGNAMRSDEVRDQAYLIPVAREADIVAAIASFMYLPPGVQPGTRQPHVNLFEQLVKSNGGTVSGATLDALDEYVRTLKSDGTWDRKRVVWPCVGDNLNAALCLLKFPLGFNNGVMRVEGIAPTSFIETQGLVGNGQFLLDTGYTPGALGMRLDTGHMAVYSHTNMPGNSVVDAGRYGGADGTVSLAMHYSAEYPRPFFDTYSVTGGRLTAAQPYPTTGYYLGNRVSHSETALYRNQTLLATGNTGGGRVPENSMLIFSYQGGFYSSRRILSHFSAGPHLTESQLATDARALEQLQKRLGRSVTR